MRKVTKIICTICNQEISLSNYNKHLRRHVMHPETFKKCNYLKHKDLNCQFCGKECKSLNSLKSHEGLCKLNPNKRPSNFVKYNQTRDPWNKGLTKKTDTRIALQGEKLHQKYKTGELIPHKSPMLDDKIKSKHKKIMQEVYKNRIPHAHARSKHGYYNGIWFESSWELMFIVYCLENNIEFSRNMQGFQYVYNDDIKTYFPDFYLPKTQQYVEVKGVQTEKDLIKWKQFKNKLVIINQESDEFKKIKKYIVSKYGKNYFKNIMAVESGTK